MTTTVLDELKESLLKSGAVNRSIEATPAAVLWPDADGQWAPVVQRLKAEWDHVLAFGDYQLEENQGPAIWIKCMIAKMLPDADWPAETVPIVYLPNVSRFDLRAIESCPRELQPLAELQYRGAYWSQTNGRDWTLNAFLSSKHGGLRLDVSSDKATQQALARAVSELLDTPVADLKGRRLEASDFDALITGDPVRDVLAWLSNPENVQDEWQGARWEAFHSRCSEGLGFDPVKDGPLVGAEQLAAAEGKWSDVWARYTESWRAFPGIPQQLNSVEPPDDLFADKSRYPAVNEQAEEVLRQALLAMDSNDHAGAVEEITQLEKEHGLRRNWIWADMDKAPLARALEPLAKIAAKSAEPFGGQSRQQMQQAYELEFWQIDAWALEAMALVYRGANVQAVQRALEALYVPWLKSTNERFQALIRQDGMPGYDGVKEEAAAYNAKGDCWIFVDGLRLDVAHKLCEALNERGRSPQLSTGWSTIPTVTASGKIMASPLNDVAAGNAGSTDFVPTDGSEKRMDTARLRRMLKDQGWQILKLADTGNPEGRAWVENGDLDHYGHEHGLRLARDLEHQLQPIVERIEGLLDAGWKRLRIVTDHGWLLVPGRMSKTDLPKYLAETRWGRCAVLKDTAHPTALTLGWTWCQDVSIAMAPGISSFIAGQEYAHGGLSLQESIIPVITLVGSSSATIGEVVHIVDIEWRGLRCRVELDSSIAGLTVDIRSKANDAASTMTGDSGMKPAEDGKASLIIEDEDLEGAAALVVVMNGQGKVIAKKTTTVGGGD